MFSRPSILGRACRNVADEENQAEPAKTHRTYRRGEGGYFYTREERVESSPAACHRTFSGYADLGASLLHPDRCLVTLDGRFRTSRSSARFLSLDRREKSSVPRSARFIPPTITKRSSFPRAHLENPISTKVCQADELLGRTRNLTFVHPIAMQPVINRSTVRNETRSILGPFWSL